MNAVVLVFFLLTGAEPAAGGKKNEKDNDRSKSEKKPMRYHRFDFESSVVEVAEIRARTWWVYIIHVYICTLHRTVPDLEAYARLTLATVL